MVSFAGDARATRVRGGMDSPNNLNRSRTNPLRGLFRLLVGFVLLAYLFAIVWHWTYAKRDAETQLLYIKSSLVEMTRLGVQLGGRFETFMGLSGLGDLILTTTGDLSRNRQVGLRLARGQSLDAILSELGHVAEGVTTAREVAALTSELGVDMPITRAVCQMLFEGLPAAQAVDALLNRHIKTEFFKPA